MRLSDILGGEELGHPVSYYPKLAALIGVKQCLLLSQLIYWIGKQSNKEGWIYKSRDELLEETGLSHEEQEFARQSLRKKGLLEEDHRRLEHRLYYRPNIEALNALWEETRAQERRPETAGAGLGKPSEPVPSEPSEPVSSNEAETTAETTAEKTPPASPSPASAEVASEPPKPDPAHAFADWFKTLLADTVRPSSNWREAWARCYDDLIRLDKRTKEQIIAVCRWGRADEFWSGNFFSPEKLRKRKDGVLYFDRFMEEMKKRPGKTSAERKTARASTEYAGVGKLPVFDPMAR